MMEKVVIITGVVIGASLIACTAICTFAMTKKLRDTGVE